MRHTLLFVEITFLLNICFIINSWGNEEEGFCYKATDGVKCVNEKDLKLTRLEGGEVGDVREITLDDDRVIKLKTLNTKPLLFEIKDFLTDEECDHFITVAKEIGLKNSQTTRMFEIDQGLQLKDLNGDMRLSLAEMKLTLEDGFDIYMEDDDLIEMYKELNIDPNEDGFVTKDELELTKPVKIKDYLKALIEDNPEKHSRFSKQAWLFADESTDEVFKKVQDRVANVVELPLDLVKLSDFQVVSYGVKGHYNAHTDSSQITDKAPCCDRNKTTRCRICRYMTILFYLNDVVEGGETAFPFANKEVLNLTESRLQRTQHLYKNCEEVGLRVPAEKRKAIIWYNHLIDNETHWMGELDSYTLHGGCPVTEGEKWIANFWIKTNDDKSIDIEKMRNLTSIPTVPEKTEL